MINPNLELLNIVNFTIVNAKIAAIKIIRIVVSTTKKLEIYIPNKNDNNIAKNILDFGKLKYIFLLDTGIN